MALRYIPEEPCGLYSNLNCTIDTQQAKRYCKGTATTRLVYVRITAPLASLMISWVSDYLISRRPLKEGHVNSFLLHDRLVTQDLGA